MMTRFMTFIIKIPPETDYPFRTRIHTIAGLLMLLLCNSVRVIYSDYSFLFCFHCIMQHQVLQAYG